MRSNSKIGWRNCWIFFVVAIGVISTALPSVALAAQDAPTIKFLSPTSFAGEKPVLTDEDNGVNSTYRLSAWAGGAPEGALAEFELIPGDDLTQPITIGGATAVTQDTFEYQWDVAEGIAGVTEGDHTLKVTLYDSFGEELDSDEIVVSILHGGGTPGVAGTTPSIDITYPVSGGPFGFFTGTDRVTAGVVDATKSVAAASTAVATFFSTSAPGTEPAWSTCNRSESDPGFADGVRCRLPVDDEETPENEAVLPAQVSAVGVLLLNSQGSADVARIKPYVQELSNLSLEMFGSTASGTISVTTAGVPHKDQDAVSGTFPCSDWIRAGAIDQLGRKVAGANIDVIAQGPSDQLKFHTSYLAPPLGTRLNQPPDALEMATEPGVRCVSTHDTIGRQGERNVAARADKKYIESTVGTTDGGIFDLRLRTDQPGSTTVTVWAEKLDDDRFCLDELDLSASTQLSWGVADAGTIYGPEVVQGCRSFDPATAGDRSIKAWSSLTRITRGEVVRFSGEVIAVQTKCEAAVPVKLKAKVPDASTYRTIKAVITSGAGSFFVEIKPRRTATYRLVAPAVDGCVETRTAEPLKVRVKS